MDPLTTAEAPWVPVTSISGKRPLSWSDAGNSTMYECAYRGRPYLFKEYTEDFRRGADGSALGRLVAWRQRLADAERRHLDLVAAWPRHRVGQPGRPAGVLIPLASRHFFQQTDDSRSPRPRVMSRLIGYTAAGQVRPGATTTVKQRALGSTIEVLLWFHTNGVLVNDVHLANILCTGDGRAVYFVDCDAMMHEDWGAVTDPAAPESVQAMVPDASAPTPATDLARLAYAAIQLLEGRFDIQPADSSHLGRIVARQSADFLFTALHARRMDPVPVEEWRRLARLWLNDGRVTGTVRIPQPRPVGEPPTPTRKFGTSSAALGPGEWVPAQYRRPELLHPAPPPDEERGEPHGFRSGGVLPARMTSWLVVSAIALVAFGLVIAVAVAQGAVR